MKINLPKTMRSRIKAEREKVFEKMCIEGGLPSDEWDKLNRRYQAYTEMLKPTLKITPDTALICLTNVLGIILVLNVEKLDIIRSKAFGFIMKGRV